MSDPKRIILLVFIMASVSMVIGVVTIGILYQTAFNEEKARLIEIVKSQARLMEAIARFDALYSKDYPGGPREATLRQIFDAHNRYESYSKTGEFTLALKDDNKIYFLLTKSRKISQNQDVIAFNSELAEPMQMALSGKSGALVGLDYRGVKVLAAYEPVADLNLGMVAKIDLAEVRAPFIKAGLISGLIGIILVFSGAILFFRISNPMIKHLIDSNRKLEDALSQVKLLSGFLPICASCKKIRDDKGYWYQIESYISAHSEAQFSHGICPGCMMKLYPEINLKRTEDTLHDPQVKQR